MQQHASVGCSLLQPLSDQRAPEVAVPALLAARQAQVPAKEQHQPPPLPALCNDHNHNNHSAVAATKPTADGAQKRRHARCQSGRQQGRRKPPRKRAALPAAVAADLSADGESSDDVLLLEPPREPPILLSDWAESDDASGADERRRVDRKPAGDGAAIGGGGGGGAGGDDDDDDTLHLVRPLPDAGDDLRFACIFCPRHFDALPAAYAHWTDQHRSAAIGTFFYAVDRLVQCSLCGDSLLLRRMALHVDNLHGEVAERAEVSLGHT